MKMLGFIGTGAITAAFIEGLVASGRRNPILVSPRSERLSEALGPTEVQLIRVDEV